VRILEFVQETGSIRASAKAMKISYCYACRLLVDAETTFGAPVTERQAGGARGGGSSLTQLGRSIIKRYRAIERQAGRAIHTELAALKRLQKR
jgi:molybdate transport system regulatory protein